MKVVSKANPLFLCTLLTIILILTTMNSVEAQKYNMTYLYGSGNYISMVNNANILFNDVSPSYFDIDEEGNLILNTVDTSFVNTMHEQGTKVIPFLSNHWNRNIGRAGLKNRERLSSDIANAILKYNLDGVNVDIENVTELDKEEYVDLIKLLREKLPTDKSIVVSVAANPNNWTTGWHGSYDYEGLAKYADHLVIMAYDEHYDGGEPGAVAGIEFVEKSIKYALERVESEKIVLGIPLYGRYWKEDVLYGGFAISCEQVENLVSNYKSDVVYDKETQAVKATITIYSTDNKPKIYGKTLTSGKYVIWYENDESIAKKLELINKYDIKGVGTWRLGLENKSMWDVFKEKLASDDRVFTDVADKHWASTAIKYLKEQAWITGKTEKLYKPEDSLTRGEISAIVCRILNVELNKNENVVNSYADTKGHWAECYIEAITDLGVVEGYGNNIFKPDKAISRAEVAKIISKLGEIYDKSTSELLNKEEIVDFLDVSNKSWAYLYIKELAEKGIIKGYTDGTYKPNKNVTRAEIAEIIYNMTKIIKE